MRPVKSNIVIIIFLTLTLVLSIASSTASNVQGEPHEQINVFPLLSIFIQFAGYFTNETLNITDLADSSLQAEISAYTKDNKDITIEIADNYTRISNAQNNIIRTVKLKEKPAGLKDPHFKPFLYLDIHRDTPSSSGATIRILNE